jgi:hypothetical protein
MVEMQVNLDGGMQPKTAPLRGRLSIMADLPID